MTNTLEITGLEVGWERRVVAQLSALALNSGEIVVLAGPNGAGKSTAVKTIAGQIPALAGSATIDGVDIFTLPRRDFARRIAYVPQIIETPMSMQVEDLVLLGRNPHQKWWSWEVSTKDQAMIDEALEKTGVRNLRNRLVHDLSGGERQRVAISMALAQQTPILLLDEPTAHLDFKHQMQLLKLLDNLRKRGLSILLVLHDLSLIGRIADKVVLLEKPEDCPARIAASGVPAEVLTPTLLRQVYDVPVQVAHDPVSGITSYVPLIGD